jgi:hypothetical protein
MKEKRKKLSIIDEIVPNVEIIERIAQDAKKMEIINIKDNKKTIFVVN